MHIVPQFQQYNENKSSSKRHPLAGFRFYNKSDIRNSRTKVFCKKVVLRNFVKFTGKH